MSVLVLVAVTGCGTPAGVCKPVACPTRGNSYQSCANGDGSVTNSAGGASCSCAAGGACDACAHLIASWCGASVGGNGATGSLDNGVANRVFSGLGVDEADCTPSSGSTTAEFVFDSIMLPRSHSDFAIDLTGSGVAVNRYGDLVQALEQQGWNPQAGIDASLQSGQTVMLLAEGTSDATLTTDSCALVVMASGAPVSFPPTAGAPYSLSGMPAAFAGPLTNGSFSSAPPPTTQKPVTLLVSLPILPSTTPVAVHLVGAHVALSNHLGKIEAGQINGAISKTEIDTKVVPALAQTIEAKIMTDQGNLTQTDTQMLSIFDTGGPTSAVPAMGCATTSCTNSCQNSSAARAHACSCATAQDGYIDECEVATNGLVKNILAPDVQLFDASGNYKPNPQGTMKDSLSVGFGFTAIGARF